MSKKIRSLIRNRKKKMERQLEEAVRINFKGPVLKDENCRYELSERIQGMSHGGIGALHKMVQNLMLPQAINDQL